MEAERAVNGPAKWCEAVLFLLQREDQIDKALAAPDSE